MLDLFHFLHIIGATVFVGSVVFYDWVIGSALLRSKPEDRPAISHTIRPVSGPLLMGSLAVTLLAGIGRLFASGAIQSASDLVTGYGLRATMALVIVIGAEAFLGPLRKRMRKAIDEHDDGAYFCAIRNHRAINAGILFIVLLLMVSMRMGW